VSTLQPVLLAVSVSEAHTLDFSDIIDKEENDDVVLGV
jgi:hypothetical protein